MSVAHYLRSQTKNVLATTAEAMVFGPFPPDIVLRIRSIRFHVLYDGTLAQDVSALCYGLSSPANAASMETDGLPLIGQDGAVPLVQNSAGGTVSVTTFDLPVYHVPTLDRPYIGVKVQSETNNINVVVSPVIDFFDDASFRGQTQ